MLGNSGQLTELFKYDRIFELTIADTVKSRPRIFSVNQSTFRRVLQKMTACVIVNVSYKSQSVSNFHSYISKI